MKGRVAASAGLLLMGSILSPPRAPAAEHLLQGEGRSRLLEEIEQRQRSVTSFRATVRQHKRQPLLKAEVQSEGTLIFQRPGRLRWEVTTPEHTIFVIKDSMLLVYRPARREAERRDLRGDFGSQAALEFLNAGVGLSVTELEKRFQMEVYRDGGEITLRLMPLSRWVAQAITSIVISQADGDLIPRKIVVVGRKGERTATTLTDVVVNPQLPEDPFTLRLGADVRVREVRGPGGNGGSDR